MKTITLDEVAYQRLKVWKKGGSESFSQVIKRVVPEPGTLKAFLSFTEARGTSVQDGNEVLEEAVDRRSGAKADPWT
jgi:predicted CopG family antitoxin